MFYKLLKVLLKGGELILRAGLVILNYNTGKEVVNLLKKIKNYTSLIGIVIVDNCSSDNSYELISHYNDDRIRIIQTEKNGGYAYGNNIGIKYLENEFEPEIIFISNPDVDFDESVVFRVIEMFKKYEEYVLLGSVRVDGNNRYTQRQYWKLPKFKDELIDCLFFTRMMFPKKEVMKLEDVNSDILRVDVVPGCFFAIRVNTLKELDYFDENTFLWYEENILASKIKQAGYKEGIITSTLIKHNHDLSSTSSVPNEKIFKIALESRKYFQKRYMNLNIFQCIILSVFMKYYFICILCMIKIKRLMTKIKYKRTL